MYERDWGYDCSRCDSVLKWDKGIPLSRNQPIVFREKEDGKNKGIPLKTLLVQRDWFLKGGEEE